MIDMSDVPDDEEVPPPVLQPCSRGEFGHMSCSCLVTACTTRLARDMHMRVYFTSALCIGLLAQAHLLCHDRVVHAHQQDGCAMLRSVTW